MKKGLKWVFIVLLALVLVVGVYAAYVFIDYYRLEDNLPLGITGASSLEAHPQEGTPIRILSYNIGFGAYSDDYSFFMDGGKESRARSPEAVYKNVGGAVKTIQDMKPDLILVQEVDSDATRSYHIDQRNILTDALPDYCYLFAQNYDSPYLFWPFTQPHGANQAGVMTFSRYPITSAIRRSLPIENGPMKLVDLDRCYAKSRIPLESGRELVLYHFHLSAYTSDGTIAEEQLKMLFQDMSQEIAAGNYTLAGGDFNKDLLGNSGELFGVSIGEETWAQPIPEQLIPEGFSIVAPYDETEKVASCRNADRPYGPDSFRVTVDGFILSDNIEKVTCSVIDTGFRWSDHNPVYLDFVLK